VRSPYPVEPGYLDLKAASIYSSLSVRTLRRALAEPGGLPCYRPGGKILLSKDDIDDYLRRFRHEPLSLDNLVEEVLADFNKATHQRDGGTKKPQRGRSSSA
jgi:excisionase family DNA binding protein